MQTGLLHNRKPRLLQSLGVLAMCLSMLSTTNTALAQTHPDPRPGDQTFFYDPSNIYDESQYTTLARDAGLLQSSHIPTVVYVRTTTSEEAGADSAHAFADAVRKEWNIETEDGADNGLVLLYSHVLDNPEASTVVASWGSATFVDSGLTSGYIENVLSGDVRALLVEGHPFEALVYGMREIRYAGIYFPPSPAPIEGATRVLHNIVNWLAPVLIVVVVGAFFAMSLQQRHVRTMEKRLLWKIVGTILTFVAVLSTLSVMGRSRIGIASALLILIALAIHTWLWSHPARRRLSPIRQRSVPPTSRRMRKRRQTLRMRSLGEIRQ